MELRQLEYFVAVAEHRHFTRAARELHVAQSGLSASIRTLERELGAELFIRNTRTVELTDAGRALLVEARHTLNNAAAAKEAVAAVRGVLRGRLVLGTQQCLGALHVHEVLTRFHAAHPGVEIRLRQGGSTDLIEQVRIGDVDVAFVSAPSPSPVGVALTELAREPMVLACGPAHRLVDNAEVELEELEKETFVDFHPGWITRDVTDQALTAAGVDRRVAIEVNDVHSLLDFVGAGLGVALVPCSFTHKRTRAKFVPLQPPAPLWRVAVATAAGRRPSAAALALLSDEAIRL
ncbi:LysR family transcriptional regulator [Flindersiella endophytica]